MPVSPPGYNHIYNNNDREYVSISPVAAAYVPKVAHGHFGLPWRLGAPPPCPCCACQENSACELPSETLNFTYLSHAQQCQGDLTLADVLAVDSYLHKVANGQQFEWVWAPNRMCS